MEIMFQDYGKSYNILHHEKMIQDYVKKVTIFRKNVTSWKDVLGLWKEIYNVMERKL